MQLFSCCHGDTSLEYLIASIKLELLYNIQVKGKNGNMYSIDGPVPLEIKTGKTTFSAEHKGQVLLLSFITLHYISK